MPYLLHDCGTSTIWSQQRVLSQPSAVTTAELFSVVANIELENALARLTHLAGRRDTLEVLRHATQIELQRLPMTEKQTTRVLAAVELGRRMFASQPPPQYFLVKG